MLCLDLLGPSFSYASHATKGQHKKDQKGIALVPPLGNLLQSAVATFEPSRPDETSIPNLLVDIVGKIKYIIKYESRKEAHP